MFSEFMGKTKDGRDSRRDSRTSTTPRSRMGGDTGKSQQMFHLIQAIRNSTTIPEILTKVLM